ncbi:LOW QUALITY PROTEIN: heterogeneous nuclear ribonucleoprotein K-like [Sitophilus oryzae]|uniref:LOW QUALITY PROTEIN: heterogeneous nuclear ribonucleoprotein K-like n=1 Tax=Sitophilus oryzae TaxID=7048 RepID=A0A6J2YA77_SITOR|nr:LOW QUALITY PROTEIN: heterogeneous nuclear ribonucleoprotein K-like [Sitophilus oryzae]
MKRQADGDMGSPFKRSRRAGDEEVRLLIPSKVAGSIIGKGGQNITKLRSQYKASITVPDCPGPERLLNLSSDMDSVCNIISDVIPNLEENGAKVGNGAEIDMRMMVHQSLAGCIIGKGGNKIKEIREKLGTKIKIFSNVAPQSTDRVIQIIGEPAKCIDTLREVLTLIKASPVKGASSPYDPHNFDEFYADEYGGWGGQQRDNGRGGDRNGSSNFQRPNQRGGSNQGGPRGGGGGPRDGPRTGGPRDGGPRGMGQGGPRGGGGMRDDSQGPGNRGRFTITDRHRIGEADLSGTGPTWATDPTIPSNNFNSGGNNFNNRSNTSNGWTGSPFTQPPPSFNQTPMVSPPGPIGLSGSPGSGGKTQTQVTIPKDLAGAIIGKGGGRIRKIRQDSGAGITIDEPLPGSNDRIITISGTANEIQMAQYLLQQSVHQNAERNNY